MVGPLTLQQFLWIGGAAALSVFSFYTFTFFLWIVITVVVGLVAVALAFIKIHGRDLPHVLAAAFIYIWKPRTYTWRRGLPKEDQVDTSSLRRLEALRRKAKMQEKLQSVKTFVTTKTKRSSNQIRGEQKKEQYETVKYMTGEEEKARRVDY